MSKAKYLGIVAISFLLVFGSITYLSNYSENEGITALTPTEPVNDKKLSYTLHTQIVIDANFSAVATAEGWDGDGLSLIHI